MEERHYRLFNQIQQSHWWFVARAKILERLIAHYLPPNPGTHAPILADIGCGTGVMLPVLAKFGEVFGIDSSPNAVVVCREQGFARTYLSNDPAWQDQTFDVLTFFDVIEHIDDDLDFLRQYLRWLRPEGLVFVTVPAFMVLWSEHDEINHHRRRYTRGQLLDLLQAAGLRPSRVFYFNSLLFPPVAAFRLIKKLLPKKPGPPHSDFELTSPLVNAMLEPLFASERLWLSRFSFPAGLSIMGVARK